MSGTQRNDLEGGDGAAILSDARCPDCNGALALSDTRPPRSAYRSTQCFSTGQPRRDVVFGLCTGCALMIEDVALMLEVTEDARAEVLDAIDRARRARALFDRGRGDKNAAMSTLAGAFHALRRDVPGVEPWDPDRLSAWLQKGTASRYELLCAHFVLAVWNPADVGPFDLMEALSGWDRAHQAAFAEWAREPWWA